MGKRIRKTEFTPNYVYIDVYYQYKGTGKHTETFEIAGKDVKKAQEIGYLKTSGKTDKNDLNIYETYYDWKPLESRGKFEGGLKKVEKYTFDKEYAYAHTNEEVFSLKKYLFEKLPNKEYILVGKRVRNTKNNNLE